MDDDVSESDPWNRLTPRLYNLVRNMCNVYEEKRFTLDQIQNDPWFRKQTTLYLSSQQNRNAPMDRLMSQMNMDESDIFCSQMATQQVQVEQPSDCISMSQPLEYIGNIIKSYS